MIKYFPILLVLLFVFSCKSKQHAQITAVKDTVITDDEVTLIIDTLASDYYEGRGFGTIGIDKAALYIENYLKAANIKPYFETYRDSFEVRNEIGFNVVGFVEGIDPELKNEYIILSAHYDHVGKIKSEVDSIRNGANDNASGVSTVLNIAKLISENNFSKRSVIVALFSGEEIGLTGSAHFAKKVKKDSAAMYCGVNIDMIGSVLTDKEGIAYLSGDNRSNIREIYNKYLSENEIPLASSVGFDIFPYSDNYSIYRYLKIPAHTFSTFNFRNYEHYHRVSDEIQHVDLENTAIIVRKIAKGLIGILNSPEKEVRLKEEKP